MSEAYQAVPDIGVLYDAVPLYGARRDIGFYVEEGTRSSGPVLEIGCGTGRILLPTARAGREIAGLDSSPGMLGRLRERLAGESPAVRQRVTLHEGDARDFSLQRTFDLVTAPFRVLQHLKTIDDQLRLLSSVARHLAPGGRFAFDVFNPRFELMTKDRSAESEDTPETPLPDGRTLRRTARVLGVNWAAQLNEVELIYYVRAAPGAEPARYVQAFQMRWFTRSEIENLLGRAGFRVVSVYGDFDRSPLLDGWPEMVWIAERSAS